MTNPDEPCSWSLGEGCCADWSSYDPALQAQATRYATLILWSATGRRYGACTHVVRPCGRWCDDGFNYYWGDGFWVPYVYNGVWRNCWCGTGPGCFKCAPDCQVWLPGPVNAITQVKVDGTVIDPATYRVDDNQWLVRVKTSTTDTACWPQCQDFNLASGTNTFFVTYTRGVAVPTALLDAAKTLACEYAKACLGQACALPGRVTNVARAGVTVSMLDVETLLDKGLTGIKTVDDVIVALNPYGIKGRARILSPDLPVTREQT